MVISIAYLGPSGTYTETAALAYVSWFSQYLRQESLLCSYPSIAQALRSVAKGETDLGVVPVENSIQGSVAITLDTLWQLELQIQQALVLPIAHALLSHSSSLETIETLYSHPQALAQCQHWLEKYLPTVQLVSTASTTEALQSLARDPGAGAIASSRASQLYGIPILAAQINDYPENCTRFWVLGKQVKTTGRYISLAFNVPANVPGSLVKPLQVFAHRNINLTRIESRPTKRSLGEYIFYIDFEGSNAEAATQEALAELATYTKVVKIFGNYDILPISTEDNF